MNVTPGFHPPVVSLTFQDGFAHDKRISPDRCSRLSIISLEAFLTSNVVERLPDEPLPVFQTFLATAF
jgi:hypothetical protein